MAKCNCINPEAHQPPLLELNAHVCKLVWIMDISDNRRPCNQRFA